MSIRFSLALLLIVGVVGCNQAKQDQAAKGGSDKPAAEDKGDYNPHDVPITEEQKTELRKQTAKFPDAVAKVKEFRNATEAETKNGIPAESPQGPPGVGQGGPAASMAAGHRTRLGRARRAVGDRDDDGQ